MMGLIVCPLADLPMVVETRHPSRVLTLLDPELEMAPPKGLPAEAWLRLSLHDIHAPTPGMIAPTHQDIERLLAFAEAWDDEAPMVVHCHAGISRSTAAAYAIACARSPRVAEETIAHRLREASPQAYPNRRIVALADQVLGRGGAMVAGVEAMGGNNFVSDSIPFDFAVRHG